MSDGGESKISADLARTVRETNTQLRQFLGTVRTIRDTCPENSPLWNQLASLQLQFAGVLAESMRAVSLVAAAQAGNDIERVPQVKTEDLELHPSKHERGPPYYYDDGRKAAANDRTE